MWYHLSHARVLKLENLVSMHIYIYIYIYIYILLTTKNAPRPRTYEMIILGYLPWNGWVLSLQNLDDKRREVVCIERVFERNEFIQYTAQRPHVALMIIAKSVLRSLHGIEFLHQRHF